MDRAPKNPQHPLRGGKSLLRNFWQSIINQKSRTSKPEIPLKNEKSRTLNVEMIYPSVSAHCLHRFIGVIVVDLICYPGELWFGFGFWLNAIRHDQLYIFYKIYTPDRVCRVINGSAFLVYPDNCFTGFIIC